MSCFQDSVSNLVELLRHRAETKSGYEAYTWLVEERLPTFLSYEELDLRARSIAAMLNARGAAHSPVLLAYPAGLDFISAFFGCLYSGAIAVPVYPPSGSRGWDRLISISRDCRARFGLTTAALAKRVAKNDALSSVHWFTHEDLRNGAAEQWTAPRISPETLAFLQYTSGSTGDPKGVMVSHGNILANERAIQKSFGQNESSVIVSWLPMGHDMGLIGGVLQPLYAGARCVLFSPAAFVQEPVRWLRAISTYRATTSGGPDFAYRHCLRKISQEQKAGLDLSCWRVAFNGAEPVRRDTLNEFSEKFRDCGFNPQSFYPCYGLAESTLLVACNSGGLEQRNPASELVSCGPVVQEHKVRIVDAQTGVGVSDGEIGEILVSGPSVAQGYWGRPEESEKTFRARVADEDNKTFLRTGDLGFLENGELKVAGRLKDLIILRGQNYFPQDIEASAERSCPREQPGSCAAFAVGEAEEQRIIVVQEVSSMSSGHEAMLSSIRRAVSLEHEIHLDRVVLVPKGAIPKTSSGKVRRGNCRQLLQDGELKILAQWRSSANAEPDGRKEFQTADFDNPNSVCEWITNRLALLIGVDAWLIGPNTEIASCGIDSLAAAEFTHQLKAHGVELDFTVLFGGATVWELSLLIADSQKLHPSGESSGINELEFPLSRGQYALWLNQQLDVAASIYNLAFAARTKSAIDVEKMREACKAVAARHPILRATFPIVEGQPRQRISVQPENLFEYINTQGWEREEIEHHAAMAAYRPFDLVAGPLARIILYQGDLHQEGSGPSVILIAVHHIISDFSSLALLAGELFMRYGSDAEVVQFSAPPFSDYIRREAQVLNGDTENRLWEFWQKELMPLPPRLELPVKSSARTDSMLQTGWEATHVDVSTLNSLRRLSMERHTTLYTTLVAAFQVLLHRYSRQNDFAIGSPISLRDGGEFRHTQGYFINPVILRACFTSDPTFIEFLDHTRERVLRALDHRHLPFGVLVSRVQPVRVSGRPPLVDAIFTFLSGTDPIPDGALFGLGIPGAKLTIGGVELESLPLQAASTEFELTLMVAEATDGLHAALGYKQELFPPETAAAMLKGWTQLLEGIATNPFDRISALPILSVEETQFLIHDFNDTTLPFDEICIHRAFERKAAEMPNAVAVSADGTSLTYAELNERANRLAGYLGAAGVRPDDIVGVCLRRSTDLLVALLGILKSGAAYLPLDANYPCDRIAFMLADSGAKIVVVHEALTNVLQSYQGKIVCLDRDLPAIEARPAYEPERASLPENLAYVIYTSGTTGVPKGVMICHRNVANFFAGMDRIIGAGTSAGDAWLAVTSVCFDISVLELLWTVTRGVRVLMDSGLGAATAVRGRKIAFSLFYFASDAASVPDNRYQLLLEGAKFADQNGFEAVWTPERHFHTFGGTYPNPSVIGAALAAITDHIQIRAGSVVLPLHHPARVAEEWSVVDNLSKGRIGISFASGWHADDFVFAPANYTARREVMFRDIETVRKLWRGEQVQFQSGSGNPVGVRIYPAPRQPELPVWVTAAGAEETFRTAGEIGANVLTHLLGQSLEDVAKNVRLYREAWRKAGHPRKGQVTLMLHTFVGNDSDAVREIVREPMIAYLKDSVSLIKNFARATGQAMPEDLDSPDMKALLEAAFERYFETSGLFGTPERCMQLVEHLKEVEIDEVACLIDFGVDANSVLESLRLLATVKRQTEKAPAGFDCQPTHLQCTPSLARMLLDGEDVLSALDYMLVGGEALPSSDAERIAKSVSGNIYNMYGPTETCIWSTADLLDRKPGDVTLGRPLANTRVYVTGLYGELVPMGVPGEICIGGEGVARGYLRQPGLTATRFVPDPFSMLPGARMYRTGDRGFLTRAGRLQFMGRFDDQVKLRGHRIELGEIEEALAHHPDVREAAAMVQSSAGVNSQLVCFVIARNAHRPSTDELRAFLSKKLPEYMLPASFMWLEKMPRTPNGKLDRKILASTDGTWAYSSESLRLPQDVVEEVLASMWSELLNQEPVSADRNFFDLGGHSLLAVRLLGMVREVFQVNVELGAFFKNPTITALSQKIQALGGDRVRRSAELFRAVEQLPEEQVEVMLGGLSQ